MYVYYTKLYHIYMHIYTMLNTMNDGTSYRDRPWDFPTGLPFHMQEAQAPQGVQLFIDVQMIHT